VWSQYGDYECVCAPPLAGRQCARTCDRSLLDVAFVADLSDEIDESSEMLELFQLLAHGLPVAADHAHVALVVYSNNATVRFYLDTYDVKSQVASPCWQTSLTKEQTKQLEDVQCRALQIIFGNIPYDEARRTCNILSLAERRHELGKDFSRELSRTSRTSSSLFCQPSAMFN